MRRRWLFLVLVGLLTVGLASNAAAATTWKRLGVNPFYQPPLASEADLKALVRDRSADLKTGFAKAGYPDLYPAFVEQFPRVKVDAILVAPGEHFAWVVFKKKGTGPVAVLKDVTWKGTAPFDAYRFDIDQNGKRHEFVVPYACGNVALRRVGPIPPAPVAAPAPPPPASAPVVTPPPPPPAPMATVAPAPAAPKPAPAAPPPPPPAAPKQAAAPVAPAPVAPKAIATSSAPAPAAVSPNGLLFDVGLSRQPDPANYLFARVGYELPLADGLYLVGLVGGHVRWMGKDGGSSVAVDAMLDYHGTDRLSVGAGAGYWSGNDGQVDLIADVGYLLLGDPDGSNTSLFLEVRLPVDELGSPNEYGRLGLGLRFRL